jgi:hypothetical protein
MGSFSIWHWLILLILFGGIAFAIFSSVRKNRTRSLVGVAGPIGIGGWLIIPILGFIGVIILTAINLSALVTEFEGIKFILTDTTGATNGMLLPVILSTVFGIAVMASASICLYKIFVSKSELRTIAVIHYVLLASAGLIELWGDGVISAVLPDTAPDPSVTKDAVRGVLAAFIWIPYFLNSKRIKNTFGKSAFEQTNSDGSLSNG